MTHLKNISIPETCHQSWQQMTPADNGRHCQSCSKTVVDFTNMSNDEIINYLSVKNHVCGRFGEQQLTGVNQKLYNEDLQNAGGWKGWVMAMGLLGSTIFLKADAQTKTSTNQTTGQTGCKEPIPGNIIVGKVAMPDSLRYRVITGHITDKRNEVLPGVAIKVPLSTVGTMTDNNGDFKLQIPFYTTQLNITYVGFVSKSINVNVGQDTNFQVKLVEAPMLLGEVVVVRRPFFKRVYYKYIRRPVRKIFK